MTPESNNNWLRLDPTGSSEALAIRIDPIEWNTDAYRVIRVSFDCFMVGNQTPLHEINQTPTFKRDHLRTTVMADIKEECWSRVSWNFNELLLLPLAVYLNVKMLRSS